MAPGLFASLFSVTSPSSNAASLKAETMSKLRAGDRDAPMDVDAMSDEAEQHSPPTSDHDVVALHPTPSTTASEPAHRRAINLKEAQEVADVDMQLSSPPSSPPTTAPPTPHRPSPSSHTAAPASSKMEPSSSDQGNRSSSEPTAAAGRADSASTPTVQRVSRRRMMPARLSQVSSLLAGSMLEEELLMFDPSSPSSSSPQDLANASSTGKTPSGPASLTSPLQTSAFTSFSVVVVTSDAELAKRAVFPHAPPSNSDISADVDIKAENDDSSFPTPKTSQTTSAAAAAPPPPPASSDNDKAGSLIPRHSQLSTSSSPSLVSTLAIKRQQLIETPDFKPRDDTLYMPKTRGLRSEAAEDTSDAVYERRHRKPETAEKRQRKAEVDRLSRDRQKLLARIEQLKTVEARMLQPIVIARDQVRAEAAANNQDEATPKVDAKPLQERIEDVRRELLADAYDTLKRYDLLLSTSHDTKSSSPGPSALPSKVEIAAGIATEGEDASTRSQSPRLKIRIKGGRATWDSADSASPTPKLSPAHNEKGDVSRRVSSRQPKQRIESLPTPLTSATAKAAEESRRKRRRLSGTQMEESAAKSRNIVTHAQKSPEKARSINAASASSETPKRRRGSPEVGGTYKGKLTNLSKTTPADRSEGNSAGRRPQRAAAAAAAVASARQRQYAEHSFSDFDCGDEDEEEEEEAESAIDIADRRQHLHGSQSHSTRRASHSLRRSPVRIRDHRSPSTSSTASSISSMASSIGYMYPTVPDTGSLKVSQSLAEIQATSSPIEEPTHAVDGFRKKLKVVLARSPSVAGMDPESKKAIAEAIGSDTEEDESKREKARALTESEAESILAAFLGTTPLGKAKPVAIAESKPSPPKPPARIPASEPATLPGQDSTPSKRRSTRRDTTQSFGEKLPDLLTKTAPFDYSVMGYFRSIDKPGADKQDAEDGSDMT